MKKLFSDPHFNVMDGLDTYIDDYGKPDPIPPSMLRQMVQSKFLGLFDDEDEPSDERRRRPPRAHPADGAARRAGATVDAADRRRSTPPMKTLICDCNRTMPLDGAALAQGPRA